MNYRGNLKDKDGNVYYPETLESSEIIYSGYNDDLEVTLDKSIAEYEFVEVIFQRGSDYGFATTGKMLVGKTNAKTYGSAELIYISGTSQRRITIKVDIAGNTLTKRSHVVAFDGTVYKGVSTYNATESYLARVIGYKRIK